MKQPHFGDFGGCLAAWRETALTFDSESCSLGAELPPSHRFTLLNNGQILGAAACKICKILQEWRAASLRIGVPPQATGPSLRQRWKCIYIFVVWFRGQLPCYVQSPKRTKHHKTASLLQFFYSKRTTKYTSQPVTHNKNWPLGSTLEYGPSSMLGGQMVFSTWNSCLFCIAHLWGPTRPHPKQPLQRDSLGHLQPEHGAGRTSRT